MDRREKYWPKAVPEFSLLRTGNFHYVDKTADMWKLANNPDRLFFLGRPRRFGKSLLMGALEAYFQARRELFVGLEAEQLEARKGDQAWQTYPVLRFDMTQSSSSPRDLSDKLKRYIIDFGNSFGIKPLPTRNGPGTHLENLILQLAAKGMAPVILVDEYDAPLAHSLGEEQANSHEEFKTVLRSFYTVLKNSYNSIRFAMLTGVSQFQHVHVFSGLNNIVDITLAPEYSAICGITDKELIDNFDWRIRELAASEDKSLEDTYALLKRHYDGFRFTRDDVTLYNPYSIVWCLATLEVERYWYFSGTPFVLQSLLPNIWYDYGKLSEETWAPKEALLAFNPNSIDPIPILFQAGYLTIKGYDRQTKFYSLGFTNVEVKSAFFEWNLSLITKPHWSAGSLVVIIARFAQNMRVGKVDAFMKDLGPLLGGIPYDVTVDGQPVYEVHFQVALYIIFQLIDCQTFLEVKGQHGRSDMEVIADGIIYVLELKVKGTPEDAIAQIYDKGYGDKYKFTAKRVIFLGISFDRDSRTYHWLARSLTGERMGEGQG